jgi:hypothetical protein
MNKKALQILLKRFRNWCRPKRNSLSWFSLKENHSSRTFWDHSNCKTALIEDNAGDGRCSFDPGDVPERESE